MRHGFGLSLVVVILLSACKPLPQPPEQRNYQTMPPPRTGSYSPVTKALPVIPPQTTADETAADRTVKLGLLLPLSGDQAGLGKSMLDAATLALFDKYETANLTEQKTRVILLPEDTATGAGDAARRAIDGGAQIILGPLFSGDVGPVADVARSHSINVITFSNHRPVAGHGVYLFGFSPEEQVRRVMEFALKSGMTRVAALMPGDPYGAAVSKEITTTAETAQAHVTDALFYNTDAASIERAAVRLAASQRADIHNSFQGLLIAEGGEKLKQILAALKEQRVDLSKVKLLGTGRWDDLATLSLPVNGGWFASTPPRAYQDFERRFVKAYKYRPPRIVALSYDAVALSASLAMQEDNPFNSKILERPGGFQGPVSGLFRFTNEGFSERNLAILQTGAKEFQVIDPAAMGF